jgi:hypothetical protein
MILAAAPDDEHVDMWHDDHFESYWDWRDPRN